MKVCSVVGAPESSIASPGMSAVYDANDLKRTNAKIQWIECVLIHSKFQANVPDSML